MSAVADPEVVEGEILPVLATTPVLAVTPTVKAAELVERLNVIKEAMATAMVQGVDYGRIPGTDKPTLWKPGAEKLAVLFQLDIQTATELLWAPDAHLTVLAHTTVFHAPTGSRLGGGEAACSTREHNYAYRKQERTCPHCGAASVIKGKEEYGGGWLCWAKKHGCGAKWSDGDPAIESQPTGEIDNPDLPDLWNVVIKMAKKRAIVDGVLLVTGASAIFTQDAVPSTDAKAYTGGIPAVAPGSAPTNQPTARPAAPSERPADAKQRAMIQACARAIDLTTGELADVILLATGNERRQWKEKDAAERWLRRALDRLPARHVDAVLAGIAAKS